jgi:hypothetical protein
VVALLSPRSYGKSEAAAAAAVGRLLIMGIRMPKDVERYLNNKQ